MKTTLSLTVELEFTDDITGQEPTIIDQIGLTLQHLIEGVGLTADDSEAVTASIHVSETGSDKEPYSHSFPVLAA